MLRKCKSESNGNFFGKRELRYQKWKQIIVFIQHIYYFYVHNIHSSLHTSYVHHHINSFWQPFEKPSNFYTCNQLWYVEIPIKSLLYSHCIPLYPTILLVCSDGLPWERGEGAYISFAPRLWGAALIHYRTQTLFSLEWSCLEVRWLNLSFEPCDLHASPRKLVSQD